MGTDGFAALEALVDNALWIFTAAISIYFFVSVVINFAQAQAASVTGDRIGYAHAMQQVIGMVVMLAVAASIRTMSGEINTIIGNALGINSDAGASLTNPDGLVVIWKALAQIVVNIVISGSLVFMTVSAAFSGLSAQIAHFAGRPNAASEGVVRLMTVVVGGVVTIVSTFAANEILSRVFWN
jgi:hypothetical protein